MSRSPSRLTSKLYGDAIQIYFAVFRNMNEGTSLHTRAASPRRSIMEEVIFMTTFAANQGHAGAQWFLGEIYYSGLLETTQDLREAARWTQKAPGQGHAFVKFKDVPIMRRGSESVEEKMRDPPHAPLWGAG
jgi:TPR repeat protein